MQANGGRSAIPVAAFFAVFAALACARFAGPGPYGLDASYYAQMARHVANGEGLTSTVSLYFGGLVLPSRATISPVFPLLAGYTGRIIGIERAINIVPKIFYVLDLVMLYLLASVIGTRLGATSRAPAFLATAVFGTSAVFYSVTTHPYREGPAFFFAPLALLLLHRYLQTQRLLWVGAAGLMTALAYLSRLEMAGVAAGAIVVLLARRELRALAIYIPATVLPIVPWWMHLGYVTGFERFFSWNPPQRLLLPRSHLELPSMTAGERLADIVAGALTAFRLGHAEAYTRVFGVAALLVPVAAIVWLWLSYKSGRIGWRTPDVVVATLATGAFCLAALLWARSDFIHFLFGWRYGLTLVFLLVVAVPYLMTSAGRWPRVGTVIVLSISIVTGASNVYAFIRAPMLSFTPAERALLDSLNRERDPMIVTTRAQTLSVATDARIHGITCNTPPAATRELLRVFPIDYVIVYDQERRCAFTRGLGRELGVTRAFGSGADRIYVLERRVTPDPGAR